MRAGCLGLELMEGRNSLRNQIERFPIASPRHNAEVAPNGTLAKILIY